MAADLEEHSINGLAFLVASLLEMLVLRSSHRKAINPAGQRQTQRSRAGYGRRLAGIPLTATRGGCQMLPV